MRRFLTSGGCAAILAGLGTLTLSSQGAGQGIPAATAPPLVVTAFNGAPEPATFTSPKTPWTGNLELCPRHATKDLYELWMSTMGLQNFEIPNREPGSQLAVSACDGPR